MLAGVSGHGCPYVLIVLLSQLPTTTMIALHMVLKLVLIKCMLQPLLHAIIIAAVAHHVKLRELRL